MPRRGFDVDVVDADPGASDHTQARRGGEHVGGDLGLAANHERVVVADALAERARLQPGHDVNLARRAQPGHAILGDRVRHQDAGHGTGRRARLGGDGHPTLTGSACATVPRASACAAAMASPPRVRSPVSMRPASSSARIV